MFRLRMPCLTAGWADFLINFYVTADPRKHVCEVQVAHHTMLVARKGLPGHQVYDHVRNAIEMNEFLGVGGEQGRAARLRELRAQRDPIASTAELLRLGCKPEALIASGCGQGELEQACGGVVGSIHNRASFYCTPECFHCVIISQMVCRVLLHMHTWVRRYDVK